MGRAASWEAERRNQHGVPPALGKSTEPMHAISNETGIPKLPKTTHKELSRKRAKAYDEILKQLTNGSNTWQRTQEKAVQDVAKFRSENKADEYEHFLDLVDARLKVSTAILGDMAESDLQALLSSLSEKEASLLPVTVQHIHSVKLIKEESADLDCRRRGHGQQAQGERRQLHQSYCALSRPRRPFQTLRVAWMKQCFAVLQPFALSGMRPAMFVHLVALLNLISCQWPGA